MEVLFPVGRMVGGSLYQAKPRTDNFGKPKLDAQGQPITGFDFGVAYPKIPGQQWQSTDWGQKIKAVGDAAYPGQTSNPSFAWKVTDGDSQIPNKRNRKPCDQEGYPGHWVIWFSQGWAPKLCDAKGTTELTQPDMILPGDYVQVFANVKSNAPSPTPGVYINPIAVAHTGYHPKGRIEISSVDVGSVGFGNTAMPADISAVPVGQVVTQQTAAVAPVPAVTMPVVPNQAFLGTPAMPPAPAPAVPAPPTGPVMTAKAKALNMTYESFKATTPPWTDEQMRADGWLE